MTEQPGRRDPRIVIIGAGMAGIAVAHTFKQAGFNDFVILEKGSDIGGVWHWNRYPGLRCDIPSHAYQFAFAPKPDWKHIWPVARKSSSITVRSSNASSSTDT